MEVKLINNLGIISYTIIKPSWYLHLPFIRRVMDDYQQKCNKYLAYEVF